MFSKKTIIGWMMIDNLLDALGFFIKETIYEVSHVTNIWYLTFDYAAK